MNIQQNKIDDLNIRLDINVKNEDYSETEKKKLNEIRKKAELKGFRKGMAPMSIIQKIYGDKALFESINEIVSGALNNYISENKLKIVGEPLMCDDCPEPEWKSGNEFNFSYDIAFTPDFEVEVSKDDVIPLYEIEITDKAKSEMKENMLKQFGSLETGESAGKEDFVIVDFKQEEKTVEKVYVAVRSVEESNKKHFIGAKAGDSFEINVNEAFTDPTDRAAMLKIKKEDLDTLNPLFTVDVLEVKTYVPAVESQDTYDKMFGKDVVKTSGEFDAAVAERLSENYRQEADFRLSKDIRNYFLTRHNIALPEAFLKKWLFRANEGKFTMEDIEKDFPAFLEDYRWKLLKAALTEKYSIKVSKQDMEEAAEAFASYQYAMYGIPNVPQDMIKEFAGRILEDRRQAEQIYDNVEDKKVIESVKADVTLKNTKISVEKFRELK